MAARQFHLSGWLNGMRVAVLVAALAIAGCSGIRLWPFGEEAPARVAVPENATAYRCAGGRSFFLRMLADGDAWLILPEREVRLAKPGAAGGRRYASGASVLELGPTDGETTFNDGTPNSYTGCKPAPRE